MLSSLQSFPTPAARTSPDVVTFVVASLHAALSKAESETVREALLVVARSFVSQVAALSQKRYGSRALVSVVTLSAPKHAVDAGIMSLVKTARARRGLGDATPSLGVGPFYDNAFDFSNVPYCQQYQCFCSFNATGLFARSE